MEIHMKSLMLGSLAVGVFALIAPAQAHHSGNAIYNLGQTKEMEGTLIEFANINPHAAWYFNAPGPDGKMVKWTILSAKPAFWQRLGLSLKTELKTGASYKFKYSPSLDANKPIGLMRGIEINGKWLGIPAD